MWFDDANDVESFCAEFTQPDNARVLLTLRFHRTFSFEARVSPKCVLISFGVPDAGESSRSPVSCSP